MKSHSYKRWSTSVQTFGDSLQRQTDSARQIAKEKGWDLDESLAPDSGVSAFRGLNLKEGSIFKFKQAVESHRIQVPCVLIMDDLSRFTRLPIMEGLEEIKGLLALGVTVCTCNDRKEYTKDSLNNMADMVTLVVTLEQNNRHSKELSRKVGNARNTFREQAANPETRKLNNWKPAWLDLIGNYFQENKRADIVRRIYADFVAGKGVRLIVKELNSEGVPSFGKGKKSKGNGWNTTHLVRILKSESVIGIYQPHIRISKNERKPEGKPIHNYYPVIVDTSLFYRAQGIFAERKTKGHVGGRDESAANLFKGYITCSHCGKPMNLEHYGNTQKYNYHVLFCSGRKRGNECGGEGIIRYDLVENAILSTLWAKVLPQLAKENNRAERLLNLQGEHKTIQDKVTKLTGLLIESPSKALAESLNKLETRAGELTKEIAIVTAQTESNPLIDWQPMEQTPDTRRELRAILANEIASVKVDTTAKQVTLIRHTGQVLTLTWDAGKGANQTKENPANECFYFNGERLPYMQDKLIWQGAKNPPNEVLGVFLGSLVA